MLAHFDGDGRQSHADHSGWSDIVSRRRDHSAGAVVYVTADKRYWADNRNYDRSGRLNIETCCVGPEARDPLADYFHTGVFMGGGLGSTQQLSE